MAQPAGSTQAHGFTRVLWHTEPRFAPYPWRGRFGRVLGARHRDVAVLVVAVAELDVRRRLGPAAQTVSELGEEARGIGGELAREEVAEGARGLLVLGFLRFASAFGTSWLHPHLLVDAVDKGRLEKPARAASRTVCRAGQSTIVPLVRSPSFEGCLRVKFAAKFAKSEK
jgi:hypothetical protein